MIRAATLLACMAFVGSAYAQIVTFKCEWGVPNDPNATKDKFSSMCDRFARQSLGASSKANEFRSACVSQLTAATGACAPKDAECIKQGYRSSEAPMKAKCTELGKQLVGKP